MAGMSTRSTLRNSGKKIASGNNDTPSQQGQGRSTESFKSQSLKPLGLFGNNGGSGTGGRGM